MKKYFLFSSLSLLALLSLCLTLNVASVHAQTSFNYTDHLMDDSVFRASNTMSASDIQTFLQYTGSSLATFSDVEGCGSTSGAHYAYYASYFTCDSTPQLASKIIYDAAQAYGINPQVILATLQKEQSLITTPNPLASQLNYAMGYGCPDSGSCSYPGFFTQIDNATWQFRFDYERLTGNNTWWNSGISYPCNISTKYYSLPLLVGNNVTFKDDAGTGYATFILPNASTATLYCYTPHVYPGSSQQYYSGSYWFVYYFNLWFPTLVSAPGSGVYKIEISGTNEIKRAFPDGVTFSSYGYKWSDIMTISATALLNITSGMDMPYNVHFRDNKFVKSPDSDGVYLIENGLKRAVPDGITLISFGYSWSNLVTISAAEISYIPNGPPVPYYAPFRNGKLVTSPSGGVYLVESGKKRPFPDGATFSSYGYKWSDIVTISNTEMSYMPFGVDMAYNVNFRNNKFVKSPDSDGVYLIENGLKRAVPDGITLTSFGYSWSNLVTISAAEMAYIPNSTSVPYYAPFRNGKLVTSTSGGVYLVESGKKRPFPDGATFSSYGYKWSDIVTISATEMAYIPSGTVMPMKT